MKSYRNLKPHPLAEMVPMMSGEEYSDLMKDIRANGLKEKITLFENLILDGRHRYMACTEIGLQLDEDNFEEYDAEEDGDPAKHVIALNIRRRNLTAKQRVETVLAILSRAKSNGYDQEEYEEEPEQKKPTEPYKLRSTDVPILPEKPGKKGGVPHGTPPTIAEIEMLSGASERTVHRVIAKQAGRAPTTPKEKTALVVKKVAEIVQAESPTGGAWFELGGCIFAVATTKDSKHKLMTVMTSGKWPVINP